MTRPYLSVVIPVYREPDLETLLAHLRRILPAAGSEIIVSDGEPGYSTLRSLPDSDVVRVHSRPGRGRGLADGAAQARGEVFLFLHADTRLPPSAWESIRTLLADSSLAAGAFDLAIDSPRWSYRLIEKGVYLRSRLLGLPYGDQALFVRREVYAALDGFAPLPLMEDVDFVRRLRRAGHRLRMVTAPVRTSPRRWEKEGLVYATVRNWVLVSLSWLGVSPDRLKRWYR